MKTMILAAAALVGMGTLAANAQGVDIRVRHDNGYHRGWDHHRGWERRHEFRTGSIHGCKTVIIHREGMTKRIKKCG
ncbi:hypothetical protein SLNSH_21290 [Alsobacter soli]|uniref:Uncharacterized protein n=1 Tax=Alsobacter soli TaxID=2109933 RepID=A0A2T1HMR0_9HYPH|nr:hypothetical protein [Alsobacter soli]PSC02926.1 hypothetical protein SLNSH_21290 [Alsobacter soli]